VFYLVFSRNPGYSYQKGKGAGGTSYSETRQMKNLVFINISEKFNPCHLNLLPGARFGSNYSFINWWVLHYFTCLMAKNLKQKL